MAKKIPIEKGRSQKIDREIKRLQAEATGTTKDVRRLLQKLLIASIESDAKVEGARERRDTLADMAIDRGLDPAALKLQSSMTADIMTLLDRGPSLDHACGLLYEAADMLAEAGNLADYNAIKAIAEKINTSANVEQWRQASRPVRHVRI